MKKLICFGVCLLGLFACKKDEDVVLTTQDYLVFGHFYGQCTGETCIEMFKIENNHLYEDTVDAYPASDTAYEGNYIIRSDTKYEQVKDLVNHLPARLLEENSIVIGQPDAGDWGGIYIEVRKKGQRKFYLIDKMEENIPTYLQPFINEVEASIAKLE